MAVTLKDVALHAGVSPSTVSRTCNNHPSISEETKERVRQAMAELGYEPTFSSNNTSTTKIRTIGVILPPSKKETYENSFYLEAIRGISSFSNQKNYMNTIITGNNEEELLSVIEHMAKSGQVDGFIILYSKLDDSIINYLFNEGLLYVLIGKANQYANQTIYIDNDNLLAGQEATEYLIKKGHRQIAYVGKDFNLMFIADRKAGYQLALSMNDISYRPDFCIELPSNIDDCYHTVENLLNLPQPPTAVVACDDIAALTLERICVEYGIMVPENLSIISFNNSLLSRISTPQLTSININSFQLGIEAASQMINHIENPNLLATKIIVPHQLIERNSCKTLN